MAKYSDIKGFTVQTVTSDPAASQAATGTWASGNTMNTPRSQSGSSGTQTSGLVFAGDEYPASPRLSNKNEYYNGTNWTELAEVNTARRLISGAGASYTSAIAFAGYTTASVDNVETWNGSSWTEVNEIQTARQAVGEAGTATAALGMGGIAPPGVLDLVESWDGTNWTEVNELNTARRQIAGLGTSTAAFAVNGGPPAATIVEQWNGSTWTETTENNTGRYAGGACGTVTAGLFFGGNDPVVANTEAWDGTAWTEVSDLSTARKEAAPSVAGTSAVALASGGHTDAAKTGATEEWTTTPSDLFQKTIEGQLFYNSTTNAFKETITDITGGSWASGTNFPSSTYGQSGFGIQTSAMICGGPTAGSNTMTYDGSSFTSAPAMNTVSPANARYFAGTFGATGTSGLIAGGEPGQDFTETWNGSSWSEATDMATGRNFQAGFGVYTAGIVAGGYTSTARTNAVESWNGSAWSEIAEINTARRGGGGAGSTTSGIMFAGNQPPNTLSNAVETWDGTSWTETTEVNTAREFFGSYGPKSNNSSAMFAGGLEPGNSTKTEFWNGSSWTEIGDLGTARRSQGAAGSASEAFLTGGEAPPGATNATENWSVDLANKTIGSS